MSKLPHRQHNRLRSMLPAARPPHAQPPVQQQAPTEVSSNAAAAAAKTPTAEDAKATEPPPKRARRYISEVQYGSPEGYAAASAEADTMLRVSFSFKRSPQGQAHCTAKAVLSLPKKIYEFGRLEDWAIFKIPGGDFTSFKRVGIQAPELLPKISLAGPPRPHKVIAQVEFNPGIGAPDNVSAAASVDFLYVGAADTGLYLKDRQETCLDIPAGTEVSLEEMRAVLKVEAATGKIHFD